MKDGFRESLLNKVKVTDKFWQRYQELVMDTVIPYQEKILNDEIPGVEKKPCAGKLPYCSRTGRRRILWHGFSGQ